MNNQVFNITHYNITAAWAVDREFIYIVGPTGRALGSLWSSLGSFGSLWGALGLSLGVLWAPLDPFGLPLGSLWLSLGSPWATLAILLKIGRPLPRNVSNS